MPRQRTVKPEFFRDKTIARLGATAAVVYEALWCWADDGGVARIEPDLLKGEAFARWPDITHAVLTECLVRLHGAGRIKPYAVGDELYAEIPTLINHSPVNHPSKFRYPRDGQVVTDIAAWVSGQYTHVAISEPSAPVLPFAVPVSGSRKSPPPAREVLALIPDTYRATVEAYLRAAQGMPAAVDATIRAEGPGGAHQQRGVTWDHVGQALHDMATNGERFTAQTLRVFVGRLAKPSARQAGRTSAVAGDAGPFREAPDPGKAAVA